MKTICQSICKRKMYKHRILLLSAVLVLWGSSLAQISSTQQFGENSQSNALTVQSTVSSQVFRIKCDAIENPIAHNGKYEYSTATGTDETAVVSAAISALPHLSVRGAETEAEPHTITRGTVRLPESCGILVQDWPAMPDGTVLDCNHSSIFVLAPTGNGPIWRNENGGNTFGSDNNAEKDCRVIYVGPQNKSTGIGSAMITGSHNQMENVSTYGFKIGVGIIGQDYGYFTNLQAGHSTVGVACLAGSYSVPANISRTDYQTIDAVVVGVFSRDNQVGMLLDGCSTTKFDGGTLSFNHVADLIGGAIDFGYVDTFALEDVSRASCPVSSKLPIVVLDRSASRVAHGYVLTDERGQPIAAYQTDGGRDHLQATVSASVVGCRVAPTVRPHVVSLAGILPYAGPSTHPVAQDEFYDFNLENEGTDANGAMNRPNTGFQIILGPSTNNVRLHRFVSGLSEEKTFAHFWISDGGRNNSVIDPLLANVKDPMSGLPCQLMETSTPTQLDLAREAGVPDDQVCTPNGKPDYTYEVAMAGWKANMFRTHGFSTLGAGAGNADYETAFEADEPGDKEERVKVTPSGDIYFSDGTSAADIRTGRLGFSAMGVGAWGFKRGVMGSVPTYLGSDQGAPLFSFFFVAVDGEIWKGPEFSLSSAGIPNHSVCTATWNWSGNGKGAKGWRYSAIATCNDGQGKGPQTYVSFGHTLGNERFTQK